MPPAFASIANSWTSVRSKAELVRKQADILTFRPDVRVNRLEVAKRLREEVLDPLARGIQADTAVGDDFGRKTRSRCATAERRGATTCAPANEPSHCGCWPWRPATSSDEARAISADERLGQALNAVNALMSE